MTAHQQASPLPLFGLGALVLFYSVWACMHDIAHGDEGTGEWTVLAICALLFPLLYWSALRLLTVNAKLVWLIGVGVVLSLFNTAAVNVILHPKYAKDPLLGKTFLAAGIPMLVVVCYHLIAELLHRRARD